MTREYFDNNVDMAVEIEYEDGGRNWYTMKGPEVKEFCDERVAGGDYISDIDYCANQSDPAIREILDEAWKLFRAADSPYTKFEEAISNALLKSERKGSQKPQSRVWTEEEIKNLIQTNDIVLYRALLMLYDCQTVSEQATESTKEQNGIGFNAYDAKFLTSVSEFLKKAGFLTDKQKYITRKKLVKYNRQLTRLANEG